MKKIDEERKKALQKAEEERLKKEKEEQDRLKKESEEPGFKEMLRSQTSEKYCLILHGYLFDKDFRCTPEKMEQQAKYEKAIPYEVLRRTPNYISRLEETNAHNKRQVEEHKSRIDREEKERIRKEEEEKEKERLRQKAERKAAKAAKKAEKKEKKEKKKA